ncbi:MULTISPECIES: hypothetical protein [Sphingobacterium]|uniref:Uncharacterized protein n=1 Tax=Sphingobacterium multivorum TaxID=28454 RepID=A0ABX7CL03_SPHMU|nr:MULTISPECIES: hypothetical protein [Sphingobacterium]MBB1642926.1 hypothetical protein [Sphingobacterium sp. UME9]QQT32715.1 hypothetical protein I6I99_09225 [Sphingobacterium multivorum]QQT51366.1 hypothetical protein I6I98_13750 [Sphingobacterium multivorum]
MPTNLMRAGSVNETVDISARKKDQMTAALVDSVTSVTTKVSLKFSDDKNKSSYKVFNLSANPAHFVVYIPAGALTYSATVTGEDIKIAWA